ncbi:MAG: hypothetical protein Q7O66_01240 [Dehalococcoidia bacterium]|nr:hypothetical protein [Dehalococcoidia bacterium]
MTADTNLIARSGGLKREIITLARGPRFGPELYRELQRKFGEAGPADEGKRINFIDHFILQHHLGDGRTLLEHFVDERLDLPGAERAMLLGWRDVVEGIFEVLRMDGEALVTCNLVDDLTYRVRSNMGPGVFVNMPVGAFLMARLVPVDDEWLLSGDSGVWQAANGADARRMAREMAMNHRALMFRNPRILEQAWESQRMDRRAFIAFFGSDTVVVPGHQLAKRMQDFTYFRHFEWRDAEGKSAVDRAMASHGVIPPLPDVSLPANLLKADSVGVIYDEVDGLNYLTNFGLVEEVFANPSLASHRQHREAVLGYLGEPSIIPLPFRRLGERYPDGASLVFQQVLNLPGFLWEQNGEALLRQYKASYFEKKVLPIFIPLGPKLMQETVTGWKARDEPSPSLTPTPETNSRPGTASKKRGKGRRGKRK